MWFAEAQRIYVLPIGRVPGNILYELEKVISETFKKEVITEVQFPLP